MSLGGRPHQRRLAPPFVLGVDTARRVTTGATRSASDPVRAAVINAVSPPGRLAVGIGARVQEAGSTIAALPLVQAIDSGVTP